MFGNDHKYIKKWNLITLNKLNEKTGQNKIKKTKIVKPVKAQSKLFTLKRIKKSMLASIRNSLARLNDGINCFPRPAWWQEVEELKTKKAHF